MELQFGYLTFIPGNNSGKYPYCHSVYIDAEAKVLIDPASDRDRLLDLRNESGIDMVWLSHYHEDHFMHLDLFEDKGLWISEDDALALTDLDHFFDAYGMTGEERESWIPIMNETFHFKPRKPTRVFQGKETVDLGGVIVDVIPTPGHTIGHCSFFFREQEVLFVGDYDLTPFGPWYGDVKSDIDATIASINLLRKISAKTWIVSHEKGLLDSEPGELWDRYLNVIDERDNKLLNLLKEPRTMAQIVDARIIYRKKREPAAFYDYGEKALMGKHLQRLINKGIVTQQDEVYTLV
jgi:hydroxyacylglutathione hydrolase